MGNIDFSKLFNTLSHLKDSFEAENIIDSNQASELISDAIQELQASMDKIFAFEEELRQNKVELASFKDELNRERAILAEVLRQSPTGIVVVEALSGKAIRTNKMAKMIMGNDNVLSRSLEDHKLGGRVAFFHLDESPYEFEEMPLLRSLLYSEVVTNEELIFARKDGSQGVLNISSGPIFNDDGKVTAAVATFYNVTRRK